MQQSLQFLQAPALELQSLVQQEIEINPVLEESPDEVKPETTTEADDWDAQLKELRQSRENYSDVILRLAETEEIKATVVKLAERG